MERNFETVMIEQCSPVLAGLKAAGLFRYETSDCKDLAERVRGWNARLGEKGLRVRVLKGCVRSHWYLVYVYRESRLREVLADENVRAFLAQEGYTLIDRDTAKDPAEKQALMHQALNCGTFLMSSNAISKDGQLVNIDGMGNRVAAMCYGPRQVVVIAGMNKVLGTLDDAIARARNIAAPANAQRFGLKTPCGLTGQCGDCTSPDCICSYVVVTRNSMVHERIKVILVGEDLGL